MPRTVAALPSGARIADYLSLGVIAKTIPLRRVRAVLKATERVSIRERDLPAHVVVYYVIALALYMQSSYQEVLRCLVQGYRFLAGPSGSIKVAGKSGISQARTRLGWEPVRRLHDEIVQPIAQESTRGAWYRGRRIVSLDGSTLDVADETANVEAFERPGSGRGRSAFPQIRFVSLVESGTHVLFASEMAGCRTGEATLAKDVVVKLSKGMLCLADRGLFSYTLWNLARGSGADLLWRIKRNLRLPREKHLSDGSYLSTIYSSERDRQRRSNGVRVRVIDYRLHGVADAEPVYRLITTLLDADQCPATELAAVYHERWEIETTLDELKTHLRGAKIVLRSKTPDLVRQEFYGFLLAHFAIRTLMHEAALRADEDPDRLSFIHAVRVIRRSVPIFGAFPPSAPSGLS